MNHSRALPQGEDDIQQDRLVVNIYKVAYSVRFEGLQVNNGCLSESDALNDPRFLTAMLSSAGVNCSSRSSFTFSLQSSFHTSLSSGSSRKRLIIV